MMSWDRDYVEEEELFMEGAGSGGDYRPTLPELMSQVLKRLDAIEKTLEEMKR